MHCKTCCYVTKHRPDKPGHMRCKVCGTQREGLHVHGDFPELTDEENAIIHEARAQGWASFFPAVPDARAQAGKTLAEAKTWLARRGYDFGRNALLGLYAAILSIREEQISTQMGFGNTQEEKKERANIYAAEIYRQSVKVDDLLVRIDRALKVEARS